MKKRLSTLAKAFICISLALLTLHSCKKSDDNPELTEETSYTIGDTLVSVFVDEETGEVLQEVVFEIMNIGTDQDTVPYFAVKSHSDIEETETNELEYFDVVTKAEITEFMDDFETIYGSEAGKELMDFQDEFSTLMQSIVGGFLVSEMGIDEYFGILDKIDDYYMDETLEDDDVKNRQVDYFLDFIFYHGIDLDDFLSLLSERGFSIMDFMDRMGTFDFSTIGSEYSNFTDNVGLVGFNEFLDGFLELTKSTSGAKDTTGDVLKFLGPIVQDFLKEAAASYDGPTNSEPFNLLYTGNTNPLSYEGAMDSEKKIKWHSGANYDHMDIVASCDYNQTTDVHEGLFVSNAMISLENITIRPFHKVSAKINSIEVNRGTILRPIAEIKTKVTVILRVKCLWFSRYFQADYHVKFNAENGVTWRD